MTYCGMTAKSSSIYVQASQDCRRHVPCLRATSGILTRVTSLLMLLGRRSLQAPCHPLYVEELLHATMTLVVNGQITENAGNDFAAVLAITDVSHFRERLYFCRLDLEITNFILDEICASTNLNDESYFATGRALSRELRENQTHLQMLFLHVIERLAPTNLRHRE